MIDPKLLRSDFDRVAAGLRRRGFDLERSSYLEMEKRRKALQVQVEALSSQRKHSAKKIGEAGSKGDVPGELLRDANEIKRKISETKGELEEVQRSLKETLLGIPNCPDDSIPDGRDENDNVEFKRWGEPPFFAFEAKDHVAIAQGLGLMDNEAAAGMSGSRFTVLFGGLAKLQRALAAFMLDLHISRHGYREVYVPYLVNADALYGTGQLPKFEEDLFALSAGRYLIPTAEVPLANLCRDRIVDEWKLPLKWVSYTPCFRSEAGSYGKDTRGLIRQHQFEKVELVQVVKAEDSSSALDELITHAEAVLQGLELPYRAVELCAGDLGFAAARTCDLEVWLPSQQHYREISSCSNTRDFQARRMNARTRDKNGKTVFMHTLNASALPIGRTLAAILENCQDEKGRVRMPAALVPWMGGQELLEPEDR